MPKFIDLTNRRFGTLVCLGRPDLRDANGRLSYESVRCDCGVTKNVSRHDLAHGKIQSCGCLRAKTIAAKKKKHGHTSASGGATPTYRSWAAMISRCEDPKNKRFHRYGGRGINVCASWRNSFEQFLSDMGNRPDGLTLDRMDNNGDYEKRNCRWATSKEQGRTNHRIRLVTAFERTQSLTDWAAETGIKRETIARRLNNGWQAERALSLKVETTIREVADA